MKKNSVLIILIACFLGTFAQGKFSANTLMFLNKFDSKDSVKHKSVRDLLKAHHDINYIDAILEVSDTADIKELDKLGVIIGTRGKNLMTVSIPVNRIQAVSDLLFVKHVDVSHVMHLANDVARREIRMDIIHNGEGIERPFLGNGVLYGTYDVGIDFNNIAFKDTLGNNRFVSAYLPMNETGTKIKGNVYLEDGTFEVDGVLPGSEFSGQQLVDICTDTKKEIHGTHTVCTAVGSFKGNKYYGMAPKAEIIACGSDEQYLTSTNIINCVSYIMNKATELGKPVVINLSLAGNIGPHDGSSFEARFLDELSGEGKIIVVSAGNEGEGQLHIGKVFKADDNELKTFLKTKDGKFDNVTSGFWSNTKTPFSLSVVAYNEETNAVEYSTPAFIQEDNGNILELSSDKISDLAKFFQGNITFSGALESNNKYCTLLNTDVKLTPGYKLGVIVSAAEGTVNGWTQGSYVKFENDNIKGWTDGDANMSISDMATGVNTISVGAYDSYDTFISVENKPISFNYYTINDLAGFSSYGPDANGNTKPEICAPGFIVISAVNGYSNFYNSESKHVPYNETIDGHLEVWAPMWGTSMSSPCVAGAIATWLEVNPNLSPSEIRDIIKSTAVKDNFVMSAPNKWGAGKFNAYAGLCEVIKRASADLIPDEIEEQIKLFPNPTDGHFNIISTFDNHNSVLIIYDSMGRNVFETSVNDISMDIDLSGQLDKGVYYLQLTTADKKYVEKLVIN